MNREVLPPDGDEGDLDPRLAALFARDRGPAPTEVAAARMLLKRALARERRHGPVRSDAEEPSPAPTLLAGPHRQRFLLLAQAAGFVLLIALLAPLVPRFAPHRPASGDAVVASLANEALELGARIERWLPPMPRLGLERPLAKGGPVDRALEPWQEFGDGLRHWLAPLSSDAR